LRPVNLLPARYRRARATGERPGLAYAALGILAVVFLMILGVVLTNNQINDAKDKTAKANAEAAAANAKVGQLQAYGNFASLKASREAAVTQVADARFDYERLMREMALVLPHDTYLTTFSAAPGGAATGTATGPAVTLSGCAPTYKGVATAIVRLRKMHNVTDVNLTSSTKAAATTGSAAGGGVCPVAWNGTVTLQPEAAPTTAAPVPARLGGGQ
jgi:Tfp pilus assembly protein PilN